MSVQLPAEQVSVPRRQLDVEDYVDILQRHRAWILGPTMAGLVIGVVVAFLWPDTFQSRGVIRIEPARVSQGLLPTQQTEQLSQRMASIFGTVTARSNLVNLITQYNLYPEERKRLPLEDVVERMRTRHIRMGPVTSLSSLAQSSGGRNFTFELRFTYPDRRLAWKVCSDLISAFIDESVRSSNSSITQTTEFFREQYDTIKRDLDEVERRIAEFRAKNVGGSPEQEAALTARISASEQTITNLQANIQRITQEKIMLETELRNRQDQLQAAQAPVLVEVPQAQQARDNRLGQIDAEINQLENALTGLRERYRDDHPDVDRVSNLLKQRRSDREKLQAEILSATSRPDPAARPRVVKQAPDSKEVRSLQNEINNLKARYQSKELELEDNSRQLKEAREKIRALNAQLDMSPAAQMALNDLLRERDNLQDRYEKMSDSVEKTRLANELDTRKQSEQLAMLDPPVLPQDPTSPQRTFIIVGGLLIGLVLGGGITAFREMKDTSLKNLKDVRAYTRLAVLASIPMLENDFVVRRRRRMQWLAWSGASVLSVLLMAGSVAYYFTSKN